MINQREARAITKEEYDSLIELMLLQPKSIALSFIWYDLFFDSVVEILSFHRDYDPDFASELDIVQEGWEHIHDTSQCFHKE